MQEITAEQIITAFDDVVAHYWGARREHENRHDKKYAQDWIELGANMTILMIVFATRLYDTFHSEMEPPTSIGALDEWVKNGISRATGKTLEPWEKEISRWQARVLGWQKKPATWRADHWGMPPDHIGSRVPNQVLQNCGLLKNGEVAAARARK